MNIPKCKCDKFFASKGYHDNGCAVLEYYNKIKKKYILVDDSIQLSNEIAMHVLLDRIKDKKLNNSNDISNYINQKYEKLNNS